MMSIGRFRGALWAAITGAGKAIEPVAAMPTVPTQPEYVHEKPVRKYEERIIAGMGSGDSSDVNTYARFDALPKEERDAIRRRSSLPRMKDRIIVPDGMSHAAQEMGGGLPQEAPTIPILAGVIADTMDRAYTRDPETHKLVLKPGLPQPNADLGGREDTH